MKQYFQKTFLQWLLLNCFAVSFRNYVHRAFASVPESCKDQMEAVLKQKLTTAFAKSESWAVDWEKEPLPMLVIYVRLHSLHIQSLHVVCKAWSILDWELEACRLKILKGCHQSSLDGMKYD